MAGQRAAKAPTRRDMPVDISIVAERARLKTTGEPPKRITVYRWLNPPKPGSSVVPFPEPAGRLNGGFWWWESTVAAWCDQAGYGYVRPDA